MTITALDPSMISQLLAGSKTRGEYGTTLQEFLNSGLSAAEVSLTEGTFAGKRAKQVKVGFDNARKKTNDAGLVYQGGKEVQVVAQTSKDDENGNPTEPEHVFLINKALLGQSADGAAEADAA